MSNLNSQSVSQSEGKSGARGVPARALSDETAPRDTKNLVGRRKVLDLGSVLPETAVSDVCVSRLRTVKQNDSIDLNKVDPFNTMPQQQVDLKQISAFIDLSIANNNNRIQLIRTLCGCAAAVLLVGAFSWVFLEGDQQTRTTMLNLVLPLFTAVAGFAVGRSDGSKSSGNRRRRQ